MDSSDGLADAIIQICRASGVGAKVDRPKIPIPDIFREIVSTEKALDWALYGGEDFELVLFLPIANAELLVEKIGNGAAISTLLNSLLSLSRGTADIVCIDAVSTAESLFRFL
jgi:thiamine-monophosphate kinase